MALRTEQIESALMRAVSRELAEGLADPRARGLVTVTGVELSADHLDAVVKVSIMPAEHETLTMTALTSATARLRTRTSRRLRYRQMPRLTFKLDRTVKRQAAVLDAINQAMRLSGPGAGPETDDDSDAHPDREDWPT
jgi:ribosome-binding factor A